jgi:protein-tyrosine phosphatase
MTSWIPAAVPPPARPALDQVPARTQDGRQAAGQFGILFVCTGNMCRSVIAERLARRGLRARLGAEACRFRVTSAGTAALDGCPVHPYAAEALRCLGAGADADGAASHAMTAADIDAADLILTAGREHRDAVLALRPAVSGHAYLLREFARLAALARGGALDRTGADMPAADEQGAEGLVTAGPAASRPAAGLSAAGYSAVDQARHLVAEAAQLRGRVPYVEPAEDEITDPATSTAAFLECARAIDAGVSQFLDALCRELPVAQYRGKHAR